jgi:hypothetical protein
MKIDSTFYWTMLGKLVYLWYKNNYFFVIRMINRFMSVTTKIHFEVIKHILCYLNGTQDFGMFYEKGDANVIQRCINFTWT